MLELNDKLIFLKIIGNIGKFENEIVLHSMNCIYYILLIYT